LSDRQNISLLIAHGVLHRLAWGGSGVFLAVYLYREGVGLPEIFLCFAAILALRFLFRSLLAPVVAALGMRRTLILATVLQAAPYPALALVHGVSPALALYCAASALGAAFYFTCYHAVFSALGDARRRGEQVGWRQILMTAAAVAGPAVGGVVLATAGAWAAFGAAAVLELLAIVPLLGLDEVDPGPARSARGWFADVGAGALLFATDGWISNVSLLSWNLIMFRGLGGRFDAFGGAVAAAALAGAVFAAVLGRFVDMGHARKALWFSAAAFAANLILKMLCGEGSTVVLTVTIGTSLLTGFYTPALMIAFYNAAKRSPSVLRFQIASEGAWDVGGFVVTLTAAALCASGAPLAATFLLPLAVVPLQALLLHRTYGAEETSASPLPAAKAAGGAA